MKMSKFEAQSEEIGPDFNEAQLLRMLKRDSQGAFRRKCKKLTGDDNAYAQAVEAQKQSKTCASNWVQNEGIHIDYQIAKRNGDYKTLMRK